jgi:GNAT superfamily N-acetyltransferase
MSASFRFADIADIDRLLPLMQSFYSFERLPYDEQRLRPLLAKLIGDESLGRLILLEHDNQLLGYMVLGFGFSLEFHGPDCFIDEFYVQPEHRSKGIGAAALTFALSICRELGIDAVHLEADHFNSRGHSFYKRLGFKDHERHLMTCWLR